MIDMVTPLSREETQGQEQVDFTQEVTFPLPFQMFLTICLGASKVAKITDNEPPEALTFVITSI